MPRNHVSSRRSPPISPPRHFEPPPAGPPYQPLAPFQPVPASPYATWALVVGVLGLICFGAGPILGLIAIVLGSLGWRQVTRAGGAMRGRFSAGAGVAAGFLSIVFFVAEVALYLSLMRPSKVATNPAAKDSSDPVAAASPTDGKDDKADPAGGAPAVTSAEPPSNTSTITTVGGITIVDVALGVASLSNELRHQHAEATAHGERLLLETTTSGSGCTPCQGIAASLSDPRMQTALDKVRLVRVDREPFEEDLAELEIPVETVAGLFSARFEPARRRRHQQRRMGRRHRRQHCPGARVVRSRIVRQASIAVEEAPPPRRYRPLTT